MYPVEFINDNCKDYLDGDDDYDVEDDDDDEYEVNDDCNYEEELNDDDDVDDDDD